MSRFIRTVIFSLICISTALQLQAQNVINRIVENGEIRIGTTGQQPPFTVKSKNGEIIGFDADIGRRLAESIHVEARFVEMNFASLLDALDKGEIDIVLSGMTITPERNLRFLFAGPYLISGKSILTRNRRFIQTPQSELNSGRIEIATLKGSTSASYVEKNLSNARLTLVNSYDEAVNKVIEGVVDFMLADYSICAYASFRHQSHGLMIQEKLFSAEQIGIAIPPDDPLLLNLVNNFISSLDGSGELKKIEDKWFRNGSWLSEVE